MNLYCAYVGHTHSIENSTHFRKKEPPVSKAGYGPELMGKVCWGVFTVIWYLHSYRQETREYMNFGVPCVPNSWNKKVAWLLWGITPIDPVLPPATRVKILDGLF